MDHNVDEKPYCASRKLTGYGHHHALCPQFWRKNNVFLRNLIDLRIWLKKNMAEEKSSLPPCC